MCQSLLRSAEALPKSGPSCIYSRLVVILGLSGLAGLLALAATTHVPLVYDEAPYLGPVALLHQHGLSLQFIKEYPLPAGLLHNVLHWTLEPITGLSPPLVRLVNPALLVLAVLFNFLTLRLAGATQPLASSLSVVGIPFIWIFSGLALTEMLSITLTASSVLLLVSASKSQADRPTFALTTALAGGAALGFASLNRAMVLIVLGAVPCLLVADLRRSLPVVAAFVVGALAVAGPMFVLWGGLVSLHSRVPVSTTSFSAYNMTLSIAYAATVMMILAPRWYNLNVRWALGIFVAIFALNAVSGFIEISVSRTAVAGIAPSLAASVPRLAGSTMLALAALFLICSVRNIYARRGDPIWLFFCVSMLLLILSPGKIVHQFSSRYTGMASGMIILAGEPFAAPGLWRALGVGCGMLIGLSSLLSYYQLAK